MENLGSLAILLAFCFAVYSVIASVAGKLAKRPFLTLSAERAVYSVWVLLTSAVGMLLYSLLHLSGYDLSVDDLKTSANCIRRPRAIPSSAIRLALKPPPVHSARVWPMPWAWLCLKSC